ncbi:hypothetical protein KDW67_34245, partial [Burkholderia cenocepacia]|uniref:hypothetical protein n=1 Tax=Burkholderia cenocepacia TaxID=95486 RepID=UPI001B903844
AAYHLAASSQSVRHSVRRAIHRRHQLRSFNRPQHTKFLTRPDVGSLPKPKIAISKLLIAEDLPRSSPQGLPQSHFAQDAK